MCAMDLDTMIHIVQRKQSSKEDMFGIILSRKNGEKRKHVLYINKGIFAHKKTWVKKNPQICTQKSSNNWFMSPFLTKKRLGKILEFNKIYNRNLRSMLVRYYNYKAFDFGYIIEVM